MVEECTYIYESGHKCHRIPKRGEQLCLAHRQTRRQRLPFEEDAAFIEEQRAYVRHLDAMDLENLLDATGDALAGIHPLIDRKSSRKDRAAFMRTCTAVTAASERLYLANRPHARPAVDPVPAIDPARKKALSSLLAAIPDPATHQLSPDELTAACAQMLSILDPDGLTTSTFDANG